MVPGASADPERVTRAACHPEHELYCTFTQRDLLQTLYSYEEMRAFGKDAPVIRLPRVGANASGTSAAALGTSNGVKNFKSCFNQFVLKLSVGPRA